MVIPRGARDTERQAPYGRLCNETPQILNNRGQRVHTAARSKAKGWRRSLAHTPDLQTSGALGCWQLPGMVAKAVMHGHPVPPVPPTVKNKDDSSNQITEQAFSSLLSMNSFELHNKLAPSLLNN